MCKICLNVPNETPEQLLTKMTCNRMYKHLETFLYIEMCDRSHTSLILEFFLFTFILKKNHHALFSVQEQLLRGNPKT